MEKRQTSTAEASVECLRRLAVVCISAYILELFHIAQEMKIL